jgi:hypothetical protein
MILFLYKKEKKLLFLDGQDAMQMHNELIEDGYTHISSIDPAAYLSAIWETVKDSEITDSEKVQQIINLLTSG